MAFATIQQKRPKCWKICDIRYCRSVCSDRWFRHRQIFCHGGQIQTGYDTKTAKYQKNERESERKREENSLKHWYVNQSALTEGLGNP